MDRVINVIKEGKFAIDYVEKCIKVLFYNGDVLYKLEIAFSSIDHLICVDFSAKNLTSVYIPCKHVPFLYSAQLSEQVGSLKNIDINYIDWRRSILTGLSTSIKIIFNDADKIAVFKLLNTLSGIKILYCSNVKNTHINYSIKDFCRDLNVQELNQLYVLRCFISQNEFLIAGKLSRECVDLLKPLSPEQFKSVLEKVTFILQEKRFIDLVGLIKRTIISIKKQRHVSADSDARICLIKRATVTPTRVIFHFPEAFVSNRVIRNFNSEHFMCLHFVDEDLKKLNQSQNFSDMSTIYMRISSLLKSGIVFQSEPMMSCSKFMFLAMSSSQLREHGCWMFCTTPLHDSFKVRQWMGDFSGIKCIGKYAARLGQSLSSSIETFETNNYSMIPDIDTKDQKYCFSDGIGKISREKAVQICQNYFTNIEYASAFQIRLERVFD